MSLGSRELRGPGRRAWRRQREPTRASAVRPAHCPHHSLSLPVTSPGRRLRQAESILSPQEPGSLTWMHLPSNLWGSTKSRMLLGDT